jgi:hypothetical protein
LQDLITVYVQRAVFSAGHGVFSATAGVLLIVEQPQASLWGDTAPLALAPQAHDLRRWLGWRMVRSA